MTIQTRVTLILLLFLVVLGFVFWTANRSNALITSFEECVAAGYPVMESYPPQCRSGDGRLFVQDVNNVCDGDAMVCPDGSSVGRIAPSCEFSPCPSNF